MGEKERKRQRDSLSGGRMMKTKAKDTKEALEALEGIKSIEKLEKLKTLKLDTAKFDGLGEN